MQGDSAHIGDAVHIWIGLLNNEELTPYHDSIKKRFSSAMTPCHYLAYMTDPRYLGNEEFGMVF